MGDNKDSKDSKEKEGKKKGPIVGRFRLGRHQDDGHRVRRLLRGVGTQTQKNAWL